MIRGNKEVIRQIADDFYSLSWFAAPKIAGDQHIGVDGDGDLQRTPRTS